MMEKEMKVRLPPKEVIAKLEDLIAIELKTVENFLEESVKIREELSRVQLPDDYKNNMLSAYDQKFSEVLYNRHLDSLVSYVSLLAYAKALDEKGVLYAFENNWGDLRITYKPYIMKINKE